MIFLLSIDRSRSCGTVSENGRDRSSRWKRCNQRGAHASCRASTSSCTSIDWCRSFQSKSAFFFLFFLFIFLLKSSFGKQCGTRAKTHVERVSPDDAYVSANKCYGSHFLMLIIWSSGIRKNTRCKVMPDNVSSWTATWWTDLESVWGRGKTYTAKDFSATLLPSDDTPLFPLSRILLYLKSSRSSTARQRIRLTPFIARISPFKLFASYSHVPYFKRDS